MIKAAWTVSLLMLWVLITGCAGQNTEARVHLRVFEMPTRALQMQTGDQDSHKLSNSAYSVSVLSSRQFEALLRATGAQARMLTDSTRVVHNWPWETDTWVYSPTYAVTQPDAICAGSGVGSLGVREQGDDLDVHFDYMVNHRGPQGQTLIESQIAYGQTYREGDVLLFYAPASPTGQGPLAHVIAFEIRRTGPAADVLAFRR